MENQESPSVVLILFTTLYREGGAKFERAAGLLAEEKRAEFPASKIICRAIESKAAFCKEITDVGVDGGKIRELHFIGHSGMYGIMFGTTKWPEQMSPFEWRNLDIPFAKNASAHFHACRTGRWFAPFFARTFQVRTYGHFQYTTVSARKDRFEWEGLTPKSKRPIYIVSVPGKKSHGLLGSFQKYLGRPKPIPMLEFLPTQKEVDTTYDSVAPLYDQTFEDIKVRRDELRWLRNSLSAREKGTVLDIGCGTGSFLRAITDLVESAHGVDLSAGMIEHARARSANDPKLSFSRIDGPRLPFEDGSFDTVMSVLSFRYLDWDPIVKEILRVLKPGGRLLVIDMVAAPFKLTETPYLVRDKLKKTLTERRNPGYHKALRKMVTDPRWKEMLDYNPIRAEHEFKWYLESRFPGGSLSTINYGGHSRVLAFESPAIHVKAVEEMAYP